MGKTVSAKNAKTPSTEPLPIRQQHKLMTKRRLMDASVRVFLNRGYADATIDDIVTTAAVGRATFYLHFKSKLEVMQELIRAITMQNEKLIEELRDISQPDAKTLGSWIRRFVEHCLAHGDRFIVGLQAFASEPELSSEIQTGTRLAADIVAALLKKRHRVSAAEAALRGELLVFSLQHACRSLVLNPEKRDVDLIVRVMTDIWMDNLA